MNRLKNITLSSSFSVLALGIFAVPGTVSVANAQDDDGAKKTLGIEEIIVTSRKREESVFDIPVAVTAFSADDIQNMGIEELPDLVAHTPGFHYAENSVGRGGRFNRRLIFRGMNPRTDRQTRQAATVFIDGAPTIGSEIGSTDNYSRIEIIKGPQSAHFGRQTFSGAINAITKTPGNEWGGQVNASVGSWDNADFGVQVEGPIVKDKLFIRLSGREHSNGGEYVNAGDANSRLGAESTTDGGLSLFFTPTDRFSAKLRVRRWKDDDGPSVALAVNQVDHGDLATCAPGGTAGNLWAGGMWPCGEVPFIGRQWVGMDTTVTPAVAALFHGPNIRDNLIFDGVPLGFGLERNAEENSLVMDWELSNGWVISSLTAKHKNEYASFEDFDRRVTATAGTCLPLAIDPNLTSCSGDTYSLSLTANETFSQELRVTSGSEQSLRWAFGVSYAEITARTQGASKFLTGFSTGGVNLGNVSNFDPETSAVFGSVTWDFTERFSISAEARYQEDKVVEGTVGGTQFEEVYTSSNPRVILDFKPTDDTTIYATFAQGSQPGQFNAGVAALNPGEIAQLLISENCGGASAFDCLVRVPEEEITNYEAGIKTLFWDGRAQISAAVYYMDWQKIVAANIVTITSTGSGGVPAGNPRNVQVNTQGGQADLSGLELEGTILLSEHFQLDATISLVNSKIGQFESPDAGRLLGFRQLNGLDKEFSRYPGQSGTLSLSYNRDFGTDHEFFARGDYLYQGETWQTNANVSKTGAWGTTNLRVGIMTDGWRIEAYGTNVFDETGYSAFQNFPDLSFQTGGRFLFGGFIPRATYGVRASLYF
jgi:iron complex outermembrane receptor protein